MNAVQIDDIGQIAVKVKDLDRAVAFYRDTLGMRFLFQAPPSLAFFECGGIRLMLSPGEDEGQDGGTSVIYYRVDDLQGTYDQLAAGGVDLVDKPHLIARMDEHDLWMAFFRDSEGNLLGLMAEVRS